MTGTPRIGLTLGGGATNYAQYVSGSGTSNLVFSYTVQAGDNGVLAVLSPISLNGGTIADAAGNSAALTFSPSTTTGVVADTTSPTIAIGSPSANFTAGGPVTYTVTYSDANFNSSTLAGSNITVNATGTASYTTIGVSGSGASRTVTLSGITGDGTLGISIAAGTATDLAGNPAPGAGPSATFTVENTPPGITSASSAGGTYNAPFSYQISATATTVSYGARGLPNGLTVDPSSGAITGVPTQCGLFPPPSPRRMPWATQAVPLRPLPSPRPR